MVNNNTNKPTVTVAKVSESNIYVKQSDLDKMTLGSFKNDVGFISSSALSTWMREHSYLSKNEITTLINKANLVVIDSINKEYDDDAISRLNEDVSDMKGEIVAIKDKLRDIDGDYIKADTEQSFAKKADVRTINSKIESINNQITNIGNTINSFDFAEKNDIPTKVSQLQNDSNYLTEHQSLNGLARTSELKKFATKDELNNLEIPSIEGLASENWVKDFVNSKNFLTKHQSLSGLARVSQIPDISGLAEKSEIPTKVSQLENDKGYLDKHQSLAGYAKTSDLKGLATEKFVKDYVDHTVNDAEELDMSIYAKNVDLSKLSSTVSSLSKTLKGYAKITDIPDVSKFVKKDELPTTDISGLAAKDWVESQGYLKSQSLKGYVKESAIKDMATKSWVEDALAGIINESGDIDLSGFAKIEDIPTDYITPSVLTNILKSYAKSKDIPKLDGFATEAWVQENFLSEQQDLSEFAKLSDLSKYVQTKSLNTLLRGYVKSGEVYTKNELKDSFLSKTDASKQYITKTDVKDGFISKEDIKDYLKIEDYRGLREMVINQEILKDALVINGRYNSEDELRANLDELPNGFYVIGSDLYIVQNHNIISTIEGGVPQENELKWEEE